MIWSDMPWYARSVKTCWSVCSDWNGMCLKRRPRAEASWVRSLQVPKVLTVMRPYTSLRVVDHDWSILKYIIVHWSVLTIIYHHSHWSSLIVVVNCCFSLQLLFWKLAEVRDALQSMLEEVAWLQFGKFLELHVWNTLEICLGSKLCRRSRLPLVNPWKLSVLSISFATEADGCLQIRQKEILHFNDVVRETRVRIRIGFNWVLFQVSNCFLQKQSTLQSQPLAGSQRGKEEAWFYEKK